jgi:hypothetical protein
LILEFQNGFRAFEIAALKNILPGLVTMKANTALGMMFCGGALALQFIFCEGPYAERKIENGPG